ncbi:hypothetical protein BDP55DRAFT_674353, partial [Colletotrichum godetiae]
MRSLCAAGVLVFGKSLLQLHEECQTTRDSFIPYFVIVGTDRRGDKGGGRVAVDDGASKTGVGSRVVEGRRRAVSDAADAGGLVELKEMEEARGDDG